MKKTLAVLLSVICILSVCVPAVSAAATYSITFPTGIYLDVNRTKELVYALTDINTGATISGDPTTADYIISYNSETFPDLTSVESGLTFAFDIELAEQYEQVDNFVIKANDQIITRKDLTGLYTILVDRDIELTIPETETLKNFNLKTFTITHTKRTAGIDKSANSGISSFFASTEGFTVTSFNPLDPKSTDNIKGTYGQDYYFKVVLQNGYRNCIDGLDVPEEDKAAAIINTMIGLNAQVSGAEVERVGKLYINTTTKQYVADMTDDPYDDVDEENGYERIGSIYKIVGEYVKSDMDVVVSGVYTDSKYKTLTTIYRIIRLILNIVKHNTASDEE